MLLIHIIQHTPIWVWIIFVVLAKRVASACRETKVDIRVSVITPLIFVAWGLEKVVMNFSYYISDVLIYIIMLAIGSAIGYVIYKRFHKFYLKDNDLWRKKSYLPLYVLLLNFFSKYILNVFLGVKPKLTEDLTFNIIYCCICGLFAGLFIGGILNAIQNKKRLESNI